MSSSRDGWTLDAQADAFAQLLALSPGDLDAAFREAARLAEGLFPHQLEGVAALLGRPARPEQTSTIAGCGAGLLHAVTVARESSRPRRCIRRSTS